MTKDEFLALSDEEQMAWLEEQTAAGREVTDIVNELGCTRADLQGYGLSLIHI